MNAPPFAYSIADACVVTCAGRTAIYEAIRSGELIARKRGRRTVILTGDLFQWLQNLPITAQKVGSISVAGDQPVTEK